MLKVNPTDVISRSGQVNTDGLESFVVPFVREHYLEVSILDNIRHQTRKVYLQRGFKLSLKDLAVGGQLFFGDFDGVVWGDQLGASSPIGDNLPKGEQPVWGGKIMSSEYSIILEVAYYRLV